MTWALSNIRAKVRSLTGRPDTGQISDDDVDVYINRYYQYIFPAEVKPEELQSWWEFNTTDGDEDEDLDDDDYFTINNPAYCDGDKLTLYLDPSEFYARWPETTTYDESQPVDALFYGQTLLMRPTPDDTYAVKIKAWTRPAALATDTATPTLEGWGPLIALGAAIEMLTDYGENEGIASLAPMYEKEKILVMRKTTQLMEDVRTIPRW